MFALLVTLGGIIFVVGAIWLIVVAFQESLLWGFGSLLIPLVSLIFVIMHWEDARKPFFIHLAGFVLMLLASFFMPHQAHVSVSAQ